MSEQERKLYSNEKVLLRTSFFGGFEKKEVLEYINKLREQNQMMGKELDERINEVSAARSDLSAQVSSFEAKIIEMERQLEERGGKIKELNIAVETLKGEVGVQKQRVVEQQMQLNQQKDQNKQLTLQAQNYEFKAKKYDDFSAQLGDILLEAKRNANETVAEAESEAAKIKTNAVIATERAADQIKMMRGDLKEVRRQIESIINEFTARLDEIDKILEGAVDESKTADEKAAEEIITEAVSAKERLEKSAEEEHNHKINFGFFR